MSDDESEEILLNDLSNTLPADNVKYYSGIDIDTNVSVNFGQHISSVTYKETSSSSTDENIKPVKFTVHYTLPSNTLMQVNNNRQIYYKLPDNVIINDEQSGPVKENGIQTGTYQITNDGYIIIDFDSNYVKDGSTEIVGDITFNANVRRTDSTSEKETVTMGNASVDVDFSTIIEDRSDLSVDKSHGEYNTDTQTIGFTVNISTVNGSGDGDITITDYLENADSSLITLNLTDGQTINVTKFKTDDTTEILTASVSIDSDGKATIRGLPSLSEGEMYSFEYSALLNPGTKAQIITGNNNIIVSNGTITDEDSDYINIATGCILTKSGSYNEKTDNIEWTIKILNPFGQNINGYTVTDQMLSQTVDGTLKVLDQNGNAVENPGTLDNSTNTFTFGSLTGTEYRLVYETKSLDHGKTISNEALLADSNGNEINNDTGQAYVGSDRQYISKNSYSKGYDSNGNIIIEWYVKLEFQQGDFADKTYIDTMSSDSSDHYMTVNQLDGISLTGLKPDYQNVSLVKGTDYTIQCFNSLGNEIFDLTAENIKIYSYKINFIDNEIIQSLSDIEIKYESNGILSDTMAVGESVKFNNKAEFNDVYTESPYTETKKEALKKYDVLSEGSSETSHKTTDTNIEKNENGEYILKWCIIANESNNYGDNDVELIDTLPAGVRFLEDTVSFKKHNGSYYETAEGVTTAVNSETNQVVFTIPASVHNGKAFRIDYSVAVTEEYILENKTGDSTSFTNTVSDGINEASQTQKISFPLITKTGSDPKDTYDGDIVYNIDINPYALKLSETGTITVTDLLPHYSKKNEDGTFQHSWGFSATLVSLTVYDAETDEELSPSQYKLTYSDEEINTVNYAKFIAELPDEKHLKIQYVYHLASNSTIGYNGKVENTAYIDYGLGSQSVTYQNNYDLEKESSAHTATSDYIKIYKVDAKNYAIRLGGAEFNLYQWKDNTWQPLLNQNKQDDGSVVPIWGTESDTPLSLVTDDANGNYLLPEIEQGVLYKLVETKAPENYIPRTAPYYFVLNSIPSDLPEGVSITQIATLLKGGIINIENSPMENIELKVNKHWGTESALQPVDVQLLVSETPSAQPMTITVNITDSQGHEVTKKFTIDTNENIELTVNTLNAYCKTNILTVNGTNVDFSQVSKNEAWQDSNETEFKSYVKYTLGKLNESAVVAIYFSESYDYSQYEIQLTNCTEISGEISSEISIPADAAAVEKNPTVTLSEENGWTYTWTDLPRAGSDGTMYYYYVRELTEINGYTAEYDTNGVNGGEINITNRKSAEKPTLPATGGNGIPKIILIGFILTVVPISCYYLINRRKKKGVNHS